MTQLYSFCSLSCCFYCLVILKIHTISCQSTKQIIQRHHPDCIKRNRRISQALPQFIIYEALLKVVFYPLVTFSKVRGEQDR